MRSALVVTLLLPAAALGQSCTGASLSLLLSDCLAFQAFYDATGGPRWTQCVDARADPCGCQDGNRIDCENCTDTSTTSLRITSLDMYENGLVGTLPAAVANLTRLVLFGAWYAAQHAERTAYKLTQ